MTTERSGMSLETVRNWHRNAQYECQQTASSYFSGDEAGDQYQLMADEHKEMADAIDAHLSRDAVVNVPKRDASFYADGEYGPSDLAAIWNACCEAHKSLAARHAVVPDEMTAHDSPDGVRDLSPFYAYMMGWNACRKAMLAQRDGGK